MNENGKTFVKGTLPAWATALIMAICATLLFDLKTEFREIAKETAHHDVRITVLETQSEVLKNALSDLKLAQREAVLELKSINSSLNQARMTK